MIFEDLGVPIGLPFPHFFSKNVDLERKGNKNRIFVGTVAEQRAAQCLPDMHPDEDVVWESDSHAMRRLRLARRIEQAKPVHRRARG